MPTDARPLPPGSGRLAGAWALAAAAPLVAGGLAPDLDPSRHTPALGGAFAQVLTLLVALAPLLWVSLAEAEATWRQRLQEAALLGAGALPALTLAWPFAAVAPAAAAAAVVYAGALLVGAAVWLAWGRPTGRPARVAAVALLGGGLPLLAVLLRDLGSAPGLLTWLAPPLALAALLGGEGLGPALGGLAGLVGAALLLGGAPGRWLAGRARGRVRRPLQAAALALALAAASAVQGQEVEAVRPLLGPYVRPDEPYPLTATARAGAAAWLGLRSFEARWATPAADGVPVFLGGVPLGGGHRLALEVRTGDGPWRPVADALPEPVPVAEHELLVGLLGARARALAAALLGERRAVLAPLEPVDLPVLARAGEALDVVVIGAGATAPPRAAPALRAWAAAGGVAVFDDRADLVRVAGDEGEAARGRSGPWDVRPLGAGLLVAPGGDALASAGADPGLSPGLLARVGGRPLARARRHALVQAALRGREPGPSAALGRRVAGSALAVALGLWLLTFLRGRLAGATFTGGAAAVAVVVALGLRAVAAPAASVYAASREVLELPAGARVARRLELVTTTAPRPVEAELTLATAWGGLPRPVFTSPVSAVRARREVALGPGAPRLGFLASPVLKGFARLDAAALDGTFQITRGAGGRRIRVLNATQSLGLREAFAVVRGGIYPLGDLPAGAAVEFDLLSQPLPFDRWRLADPGPEGRHLRRLITAALSGRDLEETLLLVGVGGAREPLLAAGVAEERVAPPLVIVSASAETQ